MVWGKDLNRCPEEYVQGILEITPENEKVRKRRMAATECSRGEHVRVFTQGFVIPEMLAQMSRCIRVLLGLRRGLVNLVSPGSHSNTQHKYMPRQKDYPSDLTLSQVALLSDSLSFSCGCP